MRLWPISNLCVNKDIKQHICIFRLHFVICVKYIIGTLFQNGTHIGNLHKVKQPKAFLRAQCTSASSPEAAVLARTLFSYLRGRLVLIVLFAAGRGIDTHDPTPALLSTPPHTPRGASEWKNVIYNVKYRMFAINIW